MASEETYLTKEGEDALRQELKRLTEMRRPAFAQKLRDAAAQGDLKENADYHDAKEQLGIYRRAPSSKLNRFCARRSWSKTAGAATKSVSVQQ